MQTNKRNEPRKKTFNHQSTNQTLKNDMATVFEGRGKCHFF